MYDSTCMFIYDYHLLIFRADQMVDRASSSTKQVAVSCNLCRSSCSPVQSDLRTQNIGFHYSSHTLFKWFGSSAALLNVPHGMHARAGRLRICKPVCTHVSTALSRLRRRPGLAYTISPTSAYTHLINMAKQPQTCVKFVYYILAREAL